MFNPQSLLNLITDKGVSGSMYLLELPSIKEYAVCTFIPLTAAKGKKFVLTGKFKVVIDLIQAQDLEVTLPIECFKTYKRILGGFSSKNEVSLFLRTQEKYVSPNHRQQILRCLEELDLLKDKVVTPTEKVIVEYRSMDHCYRIRLLQLSYRKLILSCDERNSRRSKWKNDGYHKVLEYSKDQIPHVRKLGLLQFHRMVAILGSEDPSLRLSRI